MKYIIITDGKYFENLIRMIEDYYISVLQEIIENQSTIHSKEVYKIIEIYKQSGCLVPEDSEIYARVLLLNAGNVYIVEPASVSYYDAGEYIYSCCFSLNYQFRQKNYDCIKYINYRLLFVNIIDNCLALAYNEKITGQSIDRLEELEDDETLQLNTPYSGLLNIEKSVDVITLIHKMKRHLDA